MKFKILFLTATLSLNLFARGGDDAGNGGFAYKQSIKILEMATANLEHKIISSDLPEFKEHPEWRNVLQQTLAYDQLQKLYKKNSYRNGRKLAMDYVVRPPSVKILKPYYEAFMGKTDDELEQSSKEVEKRLLHEASHIWGYNESESEGFAIRFLNHADGLDTRPTNQIDIKPNFCSCINGKSDLINDCDAFCASVPQSSSPILYLNTIMGPDIRLNPKLGNLYNWCNVQLDGDVTAPQCFLSATDGRNVIENIPVAVTKNSNSLTANIQALNLDDTYVLKIVEGKTGSNAQSKEFQLRRKKQHADPDPMGALKVSPINQYTCLIYGGSVSPGGVVTRTSYARQFYYFAENETPAPVPPASGINQSMIVCHNELEHPGNDSAEYPRLELVPGINSMWDKADPRFIFDGRELAINKILEERLLSEYGINTNLDLFRLINFPNKPSTNSSSSVNVPLAYMMSPFVDKTGRAFCPAREENNGNDPLFNLLKDYMDDTEGLYLAEKEAESIQDGTNYKTIYGTMFVTEQMLLKYGFYVENGMKVKAGRWAWSTKTIYYYWPANDTMDPMVQGNRKLFTVRRPDEINGNVPSGISTSVRTSDKRIGCIPKARN